jgi:glycosyltransferase involved in cell wall biosynthesis
LGKACDWVLNYLSCVEAKIPDTRYKILVISDYKSPGSARPEAEIFIRLAQSGHFVHIISYPSAQYYNERFRSAGITVFEQHPTKKISRDFIRFLRTLVKENQYDVVHAFNSKGLTNAVWALSGSKAKLIAYRGYAGQTHWFDPTMYLKYFHPRVDHIICVSKDIELILARNMPGRKNKLSTIPKGHDPAWYNDVKPTSRPALGFEETEILICFLANVRPFKGLTYLLQATHFLPDDLNIRFVFIGNGYDRPEIKKEMYASPMKDRMHVMGFRHDAREILAACDCLVQCSTHGEGLSKSVLEAMSLGIAPIITNIPGNADLLEDGESGWMVPPKDAEALATAISEMASHPAERIRRGQHAKERMITHLHIDQTVQQYVELYKKLV